MLKRHAHGVPNGARDAAPVWVLADPRAGTAAQALGIAERLAQPFHTVPLEWGGLARLPLFWPTAAGLAPGARAALAPPWPRLAISAGRRSTPVSRWLRARGVRTVHCMRPGFGAADFDLLVIGRHDAPRAAGNILPILGATHRLSPERLAAAREDWAELGASAVPRVALLVGGPVRGAGMPPEDAARLVPRVLKRFPGATILATASRRTGAPATEALAAALSGVPHRLFRWGDAGPNPYMGFLAWADAVVVTGDSVSMLSEACATAAPVFVATREEGRHQRLVESLYAAGAARPLRLAQRPFSRAPLDETGRVAAAIRSRGWLPD
ncbi:mitochondrial fission ELM1 family protein [Roseomonas sp. BN140053]|uniref:mitochondrial fission ELM1 family protein n=1 Tax=Roseomonas sp. BN140053 TaxID=3391898 RepID=UPI0039ECE9FB